MFFFLKKTVFFVCLVGISYLYEGLEQLDPPKQCIRVKYGEGNIPCTNEAFAQCGCYCRTAKTKTLCSPYEMNAAVQQWSQAAYNPITQPVLLSQMHGGTLQ